MHLEQLTKTQIILLALLVSIVSSIATGIVTVSLMSQAPPTIAATVDRIIQKTVQQIVPGTSTTEITKTVVAPTSAQAPAAIAAVQKSIIRLVIKGDPEAHVVARGLIVGRNGTAITDAGVVDPALTYEAVLPNGSRTAVVLEPMATSSPFATFTLKSASSSTFTPATIAAGSKLQLGNIILKIGGSGADTAAIGIVSQLPDRTGTVDTDVASGISGAVLIDLSGAVIGMTTADSLARGQTFYSVLMK